MSPTNAKLALCSLFLSAAAFAETVPIAETGYSFDTNAIKASSVIGARVRAYGAYGCTTTNYSPCLYKANDPTNYLGSRLIYWESDKNMNADVTMKWSSTITNEAGPDMVMFMQSAGAWGKTLRARVNYTNENGIRTSVTREQWHEHQLTSETDYWPIYYSLLDLSDFGVPDGGEIESVTVFASAFATSYNYKANQGKPFSPRYGNYSDTVFAGMGPILSVEKSDASLGDYVWEDINNNGVQDSDEPGIGNVAVELLDETGALLTQTTTNSDGEYTFNDLPEGQYKVKFLSQTFPKGYMIVPQSVGANTELDSDADPITGKAPIIDLVESEINHSIDLGLAKVRESSIGGSVWSDINNDGIRQNIESGLAGFVVQLLADNGEVIAQVLSDDNGFYQFDMLTEGTFTVRFNPNSIPDGYKFTQADAGNDDTIDSDANEVTGETLPIVVGIRDMQLNVYAGIAEENNASIGDLVWYDTNNNGLQDSQETGLPDVSVHLIDSTGSRIATQQTNALGQYMFSGLTSGQYEIEFDLSTLIQGYEATQANVGNDDSVDSDADVQTGKTGIFALSIGEQKADIDMGVVWIKESSIEGYVWFDLQGNGIQESYEDIGVAGVSVDFFDGNNNLITTVTTDSNGLFFLDNLHGGIYQFKVDPSTLPLNLPITLQNVGDDESLDSDYNATTGESDLFVVNVRDTHTTTDLGIARHMDVCDIQRDFDVDRADVVDIFRAVGQSVEVPQGPGTGDADGDGLLTTNDASICIRRAQSNKMVLRCDVNCLSGGNKAQKAKSVSFSSQAIPADTLYLCEPEDYLASRSAYLEAKNTKKEALAVFQQARRKFKNNRTPENKLAKESAKTVLNAKRLAFKTKHSEFVLSKQNAQHCYKAQ